MPCSGTLFYFLKVVGRSPFDFDLCVMTFPLGDSYLLILIFPGSLLEFAFPQYSSALSM